jgi:hypothetical protein
MTFLLSGSENDIVEIKSINISPDPPKPGQNLTVNVVAYAHEVVEVRHLSIIIPLLIGSYSAVGGCICRCDCEAWPD